MADSGVEGWGVRCSSRLMLGVVAVLAGGAAPAARSAREVVAGAPAADWRQVPADALLVMELDGGRVVIQLAPQMAPVHVANIRALARAGWWTHAAIVRVQDNYVVQWSTPDAPEKLPAGVVAAPPAEYERAAAGVAFTPLAARDAYAERVGFVDGFAAGGDGSHVWLAHCYGMVGVGRDLPPDTGTGAELYAVIGHAPRHLDRNIALVGRVLAGMPVLAALPRGTAPMGMYDRPGAQVPIRRIVLASDLPAAVRPRYEVMRTGTATFAAYVEALANRRDPFFVRPAGAVDLCNAPVPARPAPSVR